MVAGAVCSRRVTHELLHDLLPRYAAGTLDDAGCDAVRLHLASGCATCLHELFEYPVGLPRTAARDDGLPPAAPAPVPPASVRPRRWGWLVVGGLGLLLAALALWTLGRLRGREAAYREQASDVAAQVVDVEAQRRALAARVAVLDRDLEAARADLEKARAEVARQAQAVRDTAEASAEQARQLEAAELRADELARALRGRQLEVNHLRSTTDAQGTLAALLAAPGLEVLRLSAVPPFRDAHGHVLWHPGGDTVLLYASGLPPLPVGRSYQVHLDFDDGRQEEGPSLVPDVRGTLLLSIPLGAVAERLRSLMVLLKPGAEPVLAGGRVR